MRFERENVTQFFWSLRFGAALCFVALLLVTIVAAISVRLANEEVDESTETPVIDTLRFVQRNEWLAQPPSTEPNKLSKVPAPYVIISHTASEPCSTMSECVLRVREIQNFHIESMKFFDIAYNFLVGGDGFVYVGRDWDAEGAHAHGWNDKSIGLSFIGTFTDVSPVEPQLQAALKLLELGVNLKKITTNYTLLGHRQVSETESPGEKLFQIIKTWKHWSTIPTSDFTFADY